MRREDLWNALDDFECLDYSTYGQLIKERKRQGYMP